MLQSRDCQAVVGWLDVRADAAFGAQVPEMVAEGGVGGEGVAQVGKPGMLRADASGQLQGLVQREMRVVGMVAHRIQRDMLQTL